MTEGGECWSCGKGPKEVQHITLFDEDFYLCDECEEERRQAAASRQAELRAMIEEADRRFWHPESDESAGGAYDYLFLTVGSAAEPNQAPVLEVEPEHLRPNTVSLGMPVQRAVERLREVGWRPEAFRMSAGRAVNRLRRPARDG